MSKFKFRIEKNWLGKEKIILQMIDFKEHFGDRPDEYKSKVPYWRDAKFEDISGEILLVSVASEMNK